MELLNELVKGLGWLLLGIILGSTLTLVHLV